MTPRSECATKRRGAAAQKSRVRSFPFTESHGGPRKRTCWRPNLSRSAPHADSMSMQASLDFLAESAEVGAEFGQEAVLHLSDVRIGKAERKALRSSRSRIPARRQSVAPGDGCQAGKREPAVAVAVLGRDRTSNRKQEPFRKAAAARALRPRIFTQRETGPQFDRIGDQAPPESGA